MIGKENIGVDTEKNIKIPRKRVMVRVWERVYSTDGKKDNFTKVTRVPAGYNRRGEENQCS